MRKRDYYDILGVKSSAKREDIRKAYHRLAHQYHPDKNPGNPFAEESFKEISEAYETLQDRDKRAAYDRTGPSTSRGGFAGFREPADIPHRSDFFSDVFDEILEDFLGENIGRRPRRARESAGRGADLRFDLEISLEEAAAGSEHTIRFTRNSVCPACAGTRCAPGTSPIPCPSCRGQGSLRSQRGFFMVNSACERCGGEGRIILRPCPRCGGLGALREKVAFSIMTPPGADNGTRLTLSGEGEAGRNGGPPGDLKVAISVAPHPLFAREGNDLYLETAIPPDKARRGGELEIPTLNGKTKIRLPANTRPQRVFTIRGFGMPVLNGHGRGDLKVKIRVEAPAIRGRRAKI
ncbi:MAG TPA: molecular chaperone DnaJ [Thermodesulfobacteriota bacterium]|nr:molecular chaperone DnaJ [Thermodesulfobacteriota bacterium]